MQVGGVFAHAASARQSVKLQAFTTVTVTECTVLVACIQRHDSIPLCRELGPFAGLHESEAWR